MHILQVSFRLSIDKRRIGTRRHDQRLIKQYRALNPAYSKSIKYRATSEWNNLDTEKRAITEQSSFARWNKEYHAELIEHYKHRTWT